MPYDRRSLLEAADTIKNAPALIPDGTVWIDRDHRSLNIVAGGRNVALKADNAEQQAWLDAMIARELAAR